MWSTLGASIGRIYLWPKLFIHGEWLACRPCPIVITLLFPWISITCIYFLCVLSWGWRHLDISCDSGFWLQNIAHMEFIPMPEVFLLFITLHIRFDVSRILMFILKSCQDISYSWSSFYILFVHYPDKWLSYLCKGVESAVTYKNLGLPAEWYGALEWVFPEWARAHALDRGEAVNILKGAVVTTDRILTVSEVCIFMSRKWMRYQPFLLISMLLWT